MAKVKIEEGGSYHGRRSQGQVIRKVTCFERQKLIKGVDPRYEELNGVEITRIAYMFVAYPRYPHLVGTCRDLTSDEKISQFLHWCEGEATKE